MKSLQFWKVLAIGGLLINGFILIFWILKPKPNELEPAIRPKNRIIQLLDFQPQQLIEYEKLIKEDQITVHQIHRKRAFFHKRSFEASLKKDQLNALDSMLYYSKELEIQRMEHFENIYNLCNQAQKKVFDSHKSELYRMFAPTKPRYQPQSMHRLPPINE